MRKQLLLSLLFIVQFTFAQVVSIGTGTTNQGLPVNPYYKYSYSQCLYLASEINQSGNIYRIQYKGTPNLDISNSNEWTVYMGHTAVTSIPNHSWIPVSEMTQVFTGTVSVVDDNVEITLTTPFNYNGTDNLIVAIDENKDSYNSAVNYFYTTSIAGVNSGNISDIRSKIFKDDNVNPDPVHPPGDSVDKSGYVANIKLDFNATVCNIPTNLSVSNITITSVDLGWTAGGSETTWNIEYGNLGFVQGNGTTLSGVSSNSYSLSNLEPSTSYDFYVQADCGGGISDWAGPFTFATACFATTNFNENFDTVTTPALPNCWAAILDNGTSSYAEVISTSSGSAHSASNHIRISNDISPETTNMILVSPELSNLNAGTHHLRFYAKNSTDSEDLQIGTVSDPTNGASFTAFQTVDINGTYNEYIVNFNTYQGTDKYIAIRRLSTTPYTQVYLDDIIWEVIPSCIKPTALTATNITATTADLGWTANNSETAWNIEYGTTGFTQGSGTIISTTTNPHTLTGLTASTTYDFYVQTNCGNGDTSTWVGPFSFTTPCASISTFPFTEEFEGITSGQPLCWGIAGTTTVNGYHWRSYTIGHQGRGIRFNSYSNNIGKTSELTTPTLNLTNLSTAELKFDFKNPTGGNFEILISTNGGTTYTSLESGLTNQANWTEKTYDITSYIGSNVKIQFKGTSNYGSGDAYIYLDNVQVKEKASLSVNEVNVRDLDGVQIYPNPFRDVVMISDIKGVEKVSIVDMAGRLVKTLAPTNELNLGDLKSGIYLINLSYENGSVKTIKAIKK